MLRVVEYVVGYTPRTTGRLRPTSHGEPTWPAHSAPSRRQTTYSPASISRQTRSSDRRIGRARHRDGARARGARRAGRRRGARPEQSAGATEGVRAAAANGGGLELVQLDLASLASVREMRGRTRRGRQAVRRDHRQRRRDGDPQGQDGRWLRDAVRHQPPRPLRVRQPNRCRCCKPGARIVNLSSAGHRFADVDLDDPTSSAPSTTRSCRLRPFEDREHSVRGRSSIVACSAAASARPRCIPAVFRPSSVATSTPGTDRDDHAAGTRGV